MVKVLVTFGLQPTRLKTELKDWSKDLHDIFFYTITKKPDLKKNANEILKVLFDKDKTLHSGHWTHVQFGTKSKFFERNNGILSLVVLTWLRQLQQFFLNEENKDQNGDWNIFRKYTGTTTNNMKETTPLANINFSGVSTPNSLTQITKIKQFKPTEDIKGVCTSLEEWALRILSLHEDIQLKELYDNDSETEHCMDRVLDSLNKKRQKKSYITDTNLPSTKENIDSNTEHKELEGLDTNTNKNEGLSNQELAVMVNRVLIESLEKADKQKKSTKKHSIKEIKNMKKTYNAASAFTTIMNNMLDKSVGYENFEEMNQDILHQINPTNEKTKEKTTSRKEDKPLESSNSEDKAPPPNKKRKSGLLPSMHKTDEKDSDNDSEEIEQVDTDEEEDDDD